MALEAIDIITEKVLNSTDPRSLNDPGLYENLRHQINDLINHDFEQLIRLLYRVDVHEDKLRILLAAEPNRPADEIIANLMIERQLQKIKTRQEFSRDENISEEDAW
jgi:hypothetical protein